MSMTRFISTNNDPNSYRERIYELQVQEILFTILPNRAKKEKFGKAAQPSFDANRFATVSSDDPPARFAPSSLSCPPPNGCIHFLSYYLWVKMYASERGYAEGKNKLYLRGKFNGMKKILLFFFQPFFFSAVILKLSPGASWED